ncbi:hypothetical protein K469DRAFT_585193 [Zopfia rhizophila CBS 207.26]|uniref:DUF7053 domain-containing protein n=1 Tax=Zopfia rhizophila CBS 207.26 TaxID=1314779 RepID=A0A6A6DUL4_9PEZI|nr:hypothetical protein K469DRAFT_585193 [Zopfia rhizophila CBS 207.26]
MSKTSVFTTITPLPAGITRQGVIDTYHNHIEMIELNPLVVDRFKCKPPSYAPAEEFHATWYTIKDKVSYLPGGLATGSVSYHACFHNLSDALQTHVYAPLGLDIRAKWTVGGSLPGEPKQPVELGLDIPREGLYIREDVKMKCNIVMMSFVKKTFKESHATLVDRLVEKAHIIEAKTANERLKGLREFGLESGGQIPILPPPGYQPSQHNPHMSLYSSSSGQSPPNSPGYDRSSFGSQGQHQRAPSYQTLDPRMSHYLDEKSDPRYPHYADRNPDFRYSQYGEQNRQQLRQSYQAYKPAPVELPTEPPPVPPKDNKKFIAELPG